MQRMSAPPHSYDVDTDDWESTKEDITSRLAVALDRGGESFLIFFRNFIDIFTIFLRYFFDIFSTFFGNFFDIFTIFSGFFTIFYAT